MFNPFSHNDTFCWVWEKSLLKTLWGKREIACTSNFSFSHNVFYCIKHRNYHFCYSVICKYFQFGLVQNFVIWGRVKGSRTKPKCRLFLNKDIGSVYIAIYNRCPIFPWLRFEVEKYTKILTSQTKKNIVIRHSQLHSIYSPETG